MRRPISIILLTAMVFSLFVNINIAQAGKGGKKQGVNLSGNNAVLFANQISVNGSALESPPLSFSLPEVRNNLLGLLSEETEIKNSISFSGSTLAITSAKYVTGQVSLSGSQITINQPIVAIGDITISASKVTIAEGAFLVSTNGSVNFYCSNLIADGAVCAANAVTISGSKTVVNDAITAKKIVIYTSSYQTDNTISDIVRTGAKDKIAQLSLYGEEGKNILYGYANFAIETMDIYGRREGDNDFLLIQTGGSKEMEIPEFWSQYTDLAAVFTNAFGFTMKADPVTLEIEDDIWYNSFGPDSDSDGVTDSFELWLSETDPDTPDSFPNPDFYQFLRDEYGTTCYDRLLQRDVSFTAEDFTKQYFYEELDNPYRVSRIKVSFSDGTEKNLRYEYEDDRLKNLYVGNNKYTITETDTYIRYFVNDTLIKEIEQTENGSRVDFFDTIPEIYCVDEAMNLVEFRNRHNYSMTYDELDLMATLAKDGVPYASFTYDAYGNYVTIDATEYSIHYTYAFPLYQANYTFGDLAKTQKVNCQDNAYAYGDILLLTDGSDGSAIPSEVVGEILSSDAKTRTLQYRIGDYTYAIQFNARGYIIKDTATIAGSSETTINEYAYDTYGNIKSVKTTANGQQTLHTYSYSNTWSDELRSYDGRTISYDTLGKPVSYYNGAMFTWAAGKLADVSLGTTQASYSYDQKGLRDEKNVNGAVTRFIYESYDLIAELSDDPMYFTYDGNFELVGFEWNGQSYYYRYDLFGDVVGILDSNGNQRCTYEYDLWGVITGITGDQALAERNPIRYRGYYYDNETGFYYLESRYYDPQTKRFISYDDLESFFYGSEEDMESLFVYCGNNPVIYCDAFGQYAYLNLVFSTFDVLHDGSKEAITSQIDSKLGRNGNTTRTDQVTLNETSDFVKFWNNDSKWGRRNVVCLNMHGTPIDVGSADATVDMDIATIKNLKYRIFDVLIIYACNCGHQDWATSNIAWAFTKVTRALIVAADGTVVPGGTGKEFYGLCITNSEFRRWCPAGSKRNAIGWMVYAPRRNGQNYLGGSVYYAMGYTKRTITQMLSYFGF